MLFNTLDFAIFFPIAFFIFWILNNKYSILARNIFLLIASYFFYGWWEWKFLVLIIVSSFTDYFVGILIKSNKSEKIRRIYLAISLVINLGILFTFKYYNFFVDSFIDAFSILGIELQKQTLDIILPVGLSFYTFQTIGYSIDVYRKRIKPEKNIITFFAYVAYFPQLVAGPIERAKNLIPQLSQKRKFDYVIAVDGLKQILWGLFLKVVIADECARVVHYCFTLNSKLSTFTLLWGAVAFLVQIYGDFAGYSHIAIGSSKLLGIKLMQNFDYPLTVRNIPVFWKKWHISLMTWFRDYVLLFLKREKGNRILSFRNILIVFFISGLWHGANWTFIAWGVVNAIYYLPFIYFPGIFKATEIDRNKIIPPLKDWFFITLNFVLVAFTSVLFRAETLQQAMNYYKSMIFNFKFSIIILEPNLLIYILIFYFFEMVNRRFDHPFKLQFVKFAFFRWIIYLMVTLMILYYSGRYVPYIYFQF